MGVIAIYRDDTGKQGITPGRVLLTTTDNLATITAADYLNFSNMQGIPLYPSDVLQVLYSFNLQTNKGTYGVFIPTFTNGVITITNNGTSLGNPTVAGDFAVFSNTIGGLQDSGYLPADPNQTKVVMGSSSAGIYVTGNTLINPMAFNVVTTTVGFADLASAAQKTLLASSSTHQYQIINLFLNGANGGTLSNWGVGNRNITITDNTTTYSIIPTASLTTLANAVWGSTALPAPSSNGNFNTLTAAGTNLIAKYSGGTTDYTSGALSITMILAQVA